MLTDEATSNSTVCQLLDILEEALFNSRADEEARRGFWYAACARLTRLCELNLPTIRGATALKSMAHQGDTFMMAGASAKHAATGSIQSIASRSGVTTPGVHNS
jgi:hypothetical protein